MSGEWSILAGKNWNWRRWDMSECSVGSAQRACSAEYKVVCLFVCCCRVEKTCGERNGTGDGRWKMEDGRWREALSGRE